MEVGKISRVGAVVGVPAGIVSEELFHSSIYFFFRYDYIILVSILFDQRKIDHLIEHVLP